MELTTANPQTHLHNLQALTNEQYDAAKETAKARIVKAAGAKPTLDQFEKRAGRKSALERSMEVALLLIFLATAMLSTLHNLQFTARSVQQLSCVAEEGSAVKCGLTVGVYDFIVAHQIALILAAELALFVFMGMHREPYLPQVEGFWPNVRRMVRKEMSVWRLLAAVAVSYIFMANASSITQGGNVLIAMIPPVFSIGIGLWLEKELKTRDEAKKEMNREFELRLAKWALETENPEDNSKYFTYRNQAIWQKLVSLKANVFAENWPIELKRYAVSRELLRESEWEVGTAMSPAPLVQEPSSSLTDSSQGSTASEERSTPPIPPPSVLRLASQL
jgi:hypothetical protein